ncbi:MAG: hypothetical protein ACOYB0_10275 [Polynucleobacter sp.]|jgi:hypothetical protein
MKRLLIISILATLPCVAFAQGDSANAPGKQKGQGQSAKQFAPGQEKGSGQSAKQFSPGQANKNQPIPLGNEMPSNKGAHGKGNQ